MKKQRLQRVASLLKEVIFDVIQKRVRNPHITTFVSVTQVEVSADLQHAKVYVSLIASEQEKVKVVEALQSAAGFIAVQASKQTDLRYFPTLTFKLDRSIETQANIQNILIDLEKKRQERESFPSSDTP